MKKSTLVRILALAKRHLPLYFTGLVFGALSAAGGELAAAMLLKNMFDAVAAAEGGALISGIVFYGGLLLLFAVISFGFTYLFNTRAALITGEMRKKAFHKLQRLPISYFDREHSGDAVARLTNDIAAAENAYSDAAMELVGKIVSGLVGITYMTVLDWRLTLYSLAIGLLSLAVNMLFVKPLRLVSRRVQDQLAELTKKVSDMLAGVLVIRTFNLFDILMDRFRGENHKTYQTSMERVSKNAVLNTLNSMIFFASHVGLVAFGTYLAINGAITIGAVMGALGIFGPIFRMLNQMMFFVTQIQSSLAAADRVFELLDQPAEAAQYPAASGDGAKGYLEFRQVSFAYPTAPETPVLQQLSFSVAQGETVALVGPSGGGKSTIFRLLLGFYPPASGTVVIAGRTLADLTLPEVRDLIAYVPQEPYLFAGTIADNIRYGRPDASDDDIIAAAKAANAHDFIQNLEHGYQTLVGERGAQLSGGQRQRIAIARAILKNAPILLLDEATSALDSESEHLVQQALERLMQGRTALVIAHRLSTVQNADRLLVIAGGQVVESGTHQQLLSAGGLYRQLYEQQLLTTESTDTRVEASLS